MINRALRPLRLKEFGLNRKESKETQGTQRYRGRKTQRDAKCLFTDTAHKTV